MIDCLRCTDEIVPEDAAYPHCGFVFASKSRAGISRLRPAALPRLTRFAPTAEPPSRRNLPSHASRFTFHVSEV